MEVNKLIVKPYVSQAAVNLQAHLKDGYGSKLQSDTGSIISGMTNLSFNAAYLGKSMLEDRLQ